MHLFTYATEDSVLYEASSSNNFGLDEILEIRKDVDAAGITVDVSRILINFDLTHMSQSVQNAGAGSSAKYYLNMYDAGSDNLTTSQSLYAYPVSQSWQMGRGKKAYDPLSLIHI